MAVLIVFIDSLRPVDAAELPFIGQLSQVRSVRPGFGYSVNLHAELFAGARPDDVGFFCEWHLDPDRSPGRRLRPILPLLDAVLHPYVFNRGVQHLLTRGYRPGHPMPNVPLRHIDKFALAAIPITSPDFPVPSLFSRHPELLVITAPPGVRKGRRDEAVFGRALSAVDSATAVLAVLPDLDGISHVAGVGTDVYWATLHQIDRHLSELVRVFRRAHPEGHVFVVSDHGMSNVEGRVRLDVERQCGPARLDRYMFFSDATMLRVWLRDHRLRPRLESALSSVPHARLVTEEERTAYGLTNRAFGDWILVLEEGYCFEPSYFARHAPRAMHGYHPDDEGHQALYAHEGPALQTEPTTLVDVYAALEEAISEGS
ncbi:MAG: alkaline phosphatase family protein [Anaerolineae bacterium]